MKTSSLILAVWMSGVSSAVWAATGSAVIKGTAEGSAIQGAAQLSDTSKGLQIAVQITGVPPGEHGFHVHEFGLCSDIGKAAGGHYNPKQTPHGHAMKDGAKHSHPGDMGNVTADAAGNVSFTTVLPDVTLDGKKNPIAGRALILHEKADDFSQPVGNAGGRIACAPILINGH